MKKAVWLFILPAVFGLMLTIHYVHERNVQAQLQSSGEPQPVIGSQNLTLEASNNKPFPSNATKAPTWTENATTQEKLKEVISELKVKAAGHALSLNKSGWLRFSWTEDGDLDAPNNGVLPNGEEIPPHYTMEVWCYVDNQGMITQRVALMKTLEGKVFQAAVRANGNQRVVSSNTLTLFESVSEPSEEAQMYPVNLETK